MAIRFKSIVETKKLFLDPEINIQQVSEKLSTNRTYLSKAINNELKVNFSSYINELRVKEAIRLFTKKEHETLTIESIAKKVGFNNRASFNSAFQKFTGVTPSFFIKNI